MNIIIWRCMLFVNNSITGGNNKLKWANVTQDNTTWIAGMLYTYDPTKTSRVITILNNHNTQFNLRMQIEKNNQTLEEMRKRFLVTSTVGRCYQPPSCFTSEISSDISWHPLRVDKSSALPLRSMTVRCHDDYFNNTLCTRRHAWLHKNWCIRCNSIGQDPCLGCSYHQCAARKHGHNYTCCEYFSNMPAA